MSSPLLSSDASTSLRRGGYPDYRRRRNASAAHSHIWVTRIAANAYEQSKLKHWNRVTVSPTTGGQGSGTGAFKGYEVVSSYSDMVDCETHENNVIEWAAGTVKRSDLLSTPVSDVPGTSV